MERAKETKMVPTQFDWYELGSFDSVYDYLIQKGYPMDVNNNIVIGTSKHTSFVGLKNCILIYTKDPLMVLQKENSQEVKQVYQDLESIASLLL